MLSPNVPEDQSDEPTFSSEYFFSQNNFLIAFSKLKTLEDSTKKLLRGIEIKFFTKDTFLMSPSNNQIGYSMNFLWASDEQKVNKAIPDVEKKLFNYMVGVNFAKKFALDRSSLDLIYKQKLNVFNSMNTILDSKGAFKNNLFTESFEQFNAFEDL